MKLSKKIYLNYNYFIHSSKLISLIYSFRKNISFWELIEKNNLPIHVMIYCLDFFTKSNLISLSEDNSYNSLINYPEKSFSLEFYSFQITQVPFFSQLHLSYESSLKRGKYILEHALPNSRLCIIGDDDFLSLSLGKYNYFKEITVINIDSRIINNINKISREQGLNVTGICVDLKYFKNKELEHAFDMVVCDPPYDFRNFKLFLTISNRLLIKNKFSSQILISFTPENMLLDVEMKCQELISDNNLLIFKKNCFASHKIPLFLTKKYDSIKKINAKLSEEKSDLEKWLLLSLGRIEYLFHLFLNK